MKRDEAVDIAKGIGIILVVLGHLVRFDSGAFHFIYAFHMPLFYALMGMIFPFELTINKYFHKSGKILLSYLLFLLIGAVVTFVVPALRADFVFNEETKRFLFFKFQPECFNVGQIWFLFNSFIVITLFFLLSKPILLPKKLKTPIKAVILTAIIFAIGIAGFLVFNKTKDALYLPLLHIHVPNLSWRDEPLPLKLDTAICALLFFYVGVLLNKSNFKHKLYDLKLGFQIIGAVLAGFVVFFMARMNYYTNICDCFFGNPVYYLIGSFSGILMVIFAASVIRRIKVKKLLTFLGRDSLLIFAIHSFFLLLYVAVLKHVFKQDVDVMRMPLSLALIGTPVVLLMIAPIVAAKLFVQKKLTQKIQERGKLNEAR